MQVHVIQNARAVLHFVRFHPVKIPFDERLPAVRVAVLRIVPPTAAGSPIFRRPKIRGPAIQHRSQCFRSRVGLFDCRRVLVGAVAQFIVRSRRRMHVAVCVIPKHRLVVEIVKFHAAVRGITVIGFEMRNPILHKLRRNRGACIGRLIVCDFVSVWGNAVAAIGHPRVGALLRAVFGNTKAARRRARFGGPTNQRHCQNCFGVGAAVLFHKFVGRGTVRQRGRIRIGFGKIFKVPIHRVIGRIVLPIVTRRRVAAHAAHGQINFIRQRFVREIHAVNVLADGVSGRGCIHIERQSRNRRRRRRCARDQFDAVNIKRRLRRVLVTLHHNAVECCSLHAQRAQRNREHAPLIRHRTTAQIRAQIDTARRVRGAAARRNRHGLSAACAAVNGKTQRGVSRCVHARARLHQIQADPARIECHAYGFRACVHRRSIVEIALAPTPILKTVLQRVIINDIIARRVQRRARLPHQRGYCCAHDEQCTEHRNFCELPFGRMRHNCSRKKLRNVSQLEYEIVASASIVHNDDATQDYLAPIDRWAIMIL